MQVTDSQINTQQESAINLITRDKFHYFWIFFNNLLNSRKVVIKYQYLNPLINLDWPN